MGTGQGQTKLGKKIKNPACHQTLTWYLVYIKIRENMKTAKILIELRKLATS